MNIIFKYGQQRQANNRGVETQTENGLGNPRRSQTCNIVQQQQQPQQSSNYARITSNGKIQPKQITELEQSDKFARIGSFESVLNKNTSYTSKIF